MPTEFRLPDIGEGTAEGEIIKWLVAEGDVVAEDTPLVEVMTDKATVEIPSPRAGKILELRAKEGEVVDVGAVILVFGELEEEAAATGGEAGAAAPPPAPAEASPAGPEPAAPAGERGAPGPSRIEALAAEAPFARAHQEPTDAEAGEVASGVDAAAVTPTSVPPEPPPPAEEAVVLEEARRLARAELEAEQPSAAILDARTRQSTPESGSRADFGGAKRKKARRFTRPWIRWATCWF